LSNARTFQPAAFTAWQDAGSSTHVNRTVSFAIAAGGLFLGAGTVASCDMTRTKNNVHDPVTFPIPDLEDQADPQDPMTPYAKLAARMEIQKESEQQEEVRHHPAARAQATSSSDVATNPSKYLSDMSAEELRIEEATRKAKQHSGGIKLFSGNGNMALSLDICRHLGINLGKATVGRFADGEANVVIHENVRGKDCYVIQPTCPPVNDNIMELLLMVSTLRRASARRITVVIPYYGYARQDRKMQVRSFLALTAIEGIKRHGLTGIVFYVGSGPYLCRGRCSSYGSHGHRSSHCR
jgi:N-terminal domain of ribose phosphate pyrophosphokinase